MAGRITDEIILQINELYLKYKVKSKVAKELGISASTVTKYLKDSYTSKEELAHTPFAQEITEPNLKLFKTNDWGFLCLLTLEEQRECNELRKEISL